MIDYLSMRPGKCRSVCELKPYSYQRPAATYTALHRAFARAHSLIGASDRLR
eukprot:COSAG06_NODE_57207_length_281_cov_0.840659_1_plen_51_part_10